MEDNILDKLQSLNKYMPFIEYLLEKDAKKHEKFIKIKRWILTKKKFPITVLDKVEQSIITQYKNLFLEDVKIPKPIMNIFNSHGEIKCVQVNLCSDDEDDGDDDLEIVSVSVPASKQFNKSEDVNNDEDKETNDILRRMEDMCKAIDEPKELEVCDENLEIDEASQSKSHSTICLEEKLFKRRRDFPQVSECPKNEPTPVIPTIDLSDDDHEEVAEGDSENLLDSNCNRVNEYHLTQSANLPNSNSFENMDVDSLIKIYTNYTKQNGIDLDSLLYNPDSQTESEAFNDNQNLIINKIASSHDAWLQSTTDYVQDVRHGQLSSAIQQNSIPSVICESTKAHESSIFKKPFFNKLNLKDPRIVRHLERIQNSPVYSALIGKMSIQPSAQLPATMQTGCISNEPTTYGEYKRLRAEKELNAKNPNEKSPENETSEKKEPDAVELKSLGTHKHNIKKILMCALQPYGDEIVDVLRKQKGNPLTEKPAQHEDEVQKKKVESIKYQIRVQDEINSVEHKSFGLDECTLSVEKSKQKEQFPSRGQTISQTASERKEKEEEKCGEKRKKHNISNVKLIKKPRKASETNLQISNCKCTPSRSSSLDTTSSNNDNSEFSKLKASILMNQPQVLLHRLTDSEIQMYTGAHTQALNVELVENASKKFKQLYATPKNVTAISNIKHKNLDCLMTERNTKFCVLCKSKPSDLTNHYRRTHKGESYVSRLTWEELDDLQLNIPFVKQISNTANLRAKKYKVRCVFCEDDLEDSFINFFMHYSTHTGEYAFQCGYCKLEKPFRVDIQSHQCHSKLCRGSRVQILYQYPPNVMVIYLYSCKICNFVQLNEANVFKHLRDHHDRRQDDATNVQKYILAAINDSESSSCESEVNLDFPGDDNITVLNEPLTEDPAVERLSDQFGEFNRESRCKPTKLQKKEENSDLATVAHSKSLECNILTNNTNKLGQEPIFHVPMVLPPDENDIKPKIEELEEFVPVNSNIEENVSSKIELTSVSIDSAANDSTTIATSFERIRAKHELESQKKNLFRSLNNTLQTPYRTYRKDTPYFGLFKCMACDCFFSTDMDEEMLQHLCDHNNSECPPDGYLRCAYCQLDAESCDSPQALICHVRSRHEYSRYQCSSCCYRSLCPSLVRIHQGIAHEDENSADDVVYECTGPVTSSDGEPDLPKVLIENVQAIICPYCPEPFYAINQLNRHLSRGHKIIDKTIMDQITLKIEPYACIYCSENLTDEREVQKHLALTHPDEHPFACLRISKTEIEVDSVYNLQLIRIPLPAVPSEKIMPALRTQQVPTKYSSSTEHAQALKTSVTNINSNLTLDSTTDIKPDLEKCIRINEDVVKFRLQKLITNTGVSPDRLYHCPHSECGGFFSVYDLWYRHMSSRHRCIVSICPHCPEEDRVELLLSDFKEHLQQHCCHLFMCFHCGETFSAEHVAKEHAAVLHASIGAFRVEKIAISLSHSFSILIEQDQHRDQLSFLLELQKVITKRLSYLEVAYTEKLKTQWVVPLTTVWLEEFPSYATSGNRRQKCIMRGCAYQSYINEKLYEHMRSHEVGNNVFSCFRCDFKEKCNTWDDIIEHVNMHHSNLYICCVCSYHHFERRKVRLHIELEHKHRDVPLLSLLRSPECTKMTLSIIFAQAKITFSTMQTCFCCSRSNIGADSYALHLKKSHGLTLKYFCEICDIHIPQLSASDDHFSKEHTLEFRKMRCELSSNSQLLINSVQPLSIQIEGSRSKRSQNATSTVHSKFPSIKEEPVDDDFDGDVVIVDDDDVVIFEESKGYRSEQKSTETPQPIRCVNIENLQPTNVNVNNHCSIVAIAPQMTTNLINASPRIALQCPSSDFSNTTQIRPVTIRLINRPTTSADSIT